MPNNSSFADFMIDKKRLLQVVDTNQAILPDVSVYRDGLEGVVDELGEISARQDGHRAGLRGETRRLRELMIRGEDLARQLRSIISGHLGPRNEKLAEFRIRVLGRPRALPPTTTDPPVPPTPEPE